MKKIIFLFAFTFSTVLFAQDRFERIDEFLTYLNQNEKFVGSLCIREGENIVFNKAYGFADVEKNVKASRQTKYKIGSITKTFTAVMIFQLMEEKKLRLETRLRKFFPKVEKSDSISVYDLLYQRSGIPDYINHDSLTQMELNSADLKETIYKKIENYKLRFGVGTKYEYSNSNYYLLGGIIEKITGKSYAENLQERIVNKIGLKNTYYTTAEINISENESYSYMFDGTQWLLTPEWKNETAFSAGAIISTPADLTQFMNQLFDGKLVTKKSVEQMTQTKDGYGAALMQFPFGDRKYFGHTGGIEGFRSVVGYYEKEKMGVSLIVNGENYNRNDIMIGVLSIYYKQPFPFPTFEKLNPELIKQYSGVYASTQLPMKLNIFEKNGELLAQATGQSSFPLRLQNEKTFIFAQAGIEIEFIENGLVLKQGGMKFNFTKETP